MKTTMTLDEIREHDPCKPGWQKLLKNCDEKTEVSLMDILENNGLDDALWAARCLPLRERRSLALRYALAVEHLNNNPRVAACNRATRQWLDGEISDEKLEAASRSAAWAAVRAAEMAAAGARSAARSAAWAAERAAWAAAEAAVWAGECIDLEQILRQWCADVESGVER